MKRSRILQKQKKTPKTLKSSSIEDIKAKMQASIEEGGFLAKVEAKCFNNVSNCFWMTTKKLFKISGCGRSLFKEIV